MSVRSAFCVCLVSALLGSACGGASASLSDQDVAAVKAQMDKYMKTALATDWDAWGSTLTDDCVTMPPNSPPLMNRAAAVAFLKSFPKLTSFTTNTTEVSGRGDMAYAVGTFAIAFTLPGGSTTTDKGSFLDVFRKQSDGSWLFSRVMWHSDALLPEQAAAEKELLALENTLAGAMIKKDRATYERVLADDYTYTHSNGKTTNKKQDIDDTVSGDTKWTSSRFDDMKVQLVGEVAIVTGVQTLVGSAKGYVPGPRRMTDIFARRNGEWQQIGGQTTIVK
jgi:ketosteroid isomerase-like protein